MSKKLVVVDAYCTRPAGSACNRCGASCPHTAITLPAGNGVPVVNHELCTGCGICFGVCDAFASTKITQADLHARIRRVAVDGRRCYITCNENIFPGFEVDTNVVVLPCISMLSPDFLTLLLAENIRLTIACDFKYCEDCQRGGELGGSLFPRAVEIAEERTGEQVKFAYRIPEKQKLLEKYTNENDPTDRRAAFTGLAADFGEIASGKRRLRNSTVLADYYQKRERQRASARLNLAEKSVFDDFTPEGSVRHVMFPKQRMMLEAVERRHDIAEKIPVVVSTTDVSACTNEGACANACPTGARTIDAKTAKLVFDVTYCVGCGACFDACPHEATNLEDTTAEVFLEAIEAAEKAAAEREAHRIKNPFAK